MIGCKKTEPEVHPMKRLQKAVALLLLLLFLLPSGRTFADGETGDGASRDMIEKASSTVDQERENAPASPKNNYDERLYQQIQSTYIAAKKRSRRRSFKGYCGAYVANQLVVLGINTSYLGANGKNMFDVYRNMACTSGGYAVTAYNAKKYTLLEALTAITNQDPGAVNILVGFQKGVSKAGKKYGHVLFIHGIRDGNVYYSENSDRTISSVKYQEGEPIVCSLNDFAEQYARYKLDGVIHFEKKRKELQPSMTEDIVDSSPEKEFAMD